MQDIKAVDILPLLQEKIAIVSGKYDCIINLVLSKFNDRTAHIFFNLTVWVCRYLFNYMHVLMWQIEMDCITIFIVRDNIVTSTRLLTIYQSWQAGI